MRRNSILLTLAVLLTISPWAGTAWGQADTPPHHHGDEAPAETQKAETQTPPMMAHHQQMQERMQAMDAELDQLLEEARSASGDAKVEALVDVVAELVEQRKAMHQMMHRQMMPMMMHHEMMQKKGHGTEGCCPMMKEHQEMMREKGHTMEDCPMMKQMKGEPDTGSEAEEGDDSEDDHSAHH